MIQRGARANFYDVTRSIRIGVAWCYMIEFFACLLACSQSRFQFDLSVTRICSIFSRKDQGSLNWWTLGWLGKAARRVCDGGGLVKAINLSPFFSPVDVLTTWSWPKQGTYLVELRVDVHVSSSGKTVIFLTLLNHQMSLIFLSINLVFHQEPLSLLHMY